MKKLLLIFALISSAVAWGAENDLKIVQDIAGGVPRQRLISASGPITDAASFRLYLGIPPIASPTFTGTVTAPTISASALFDFPTTSSISVGVIRQNAAAFIHSYGTDNLFLGGTAGTFTTTGTGKNLAVGKNSQRVLSSGTANTSTGFETLYNLTTGTDNTALGMQALYGVTGGINNVGIGRAAGASLTNGGNSIAIGRYALASATTPSYNIAIGTDALYFNTDASGANVAVGYQSQQTGTTSTGNTSVGYVALKATTTGDFNTAIGHQAGDANTTGSTNVMIGSSSMRGNTTGTDNVGIGQGAMNANTTGNESVAIGKNALYGFQAEQSVSIGAYSMAAAASGITAGGVAIGWNALNKNAGNANSAIGWSSQINTSTGDQNVSLGTESLYLNTVGGNNVGMGVGTIYQNVSGDNNTGMGTNALNKVTGSGNVAIGFEAGYWETASNGFYVDNQRRTDLATQKTSSLLYGTFNATPASQTLAINAALSVLGSVTSGSSATTAGAIVLGQGTTQSTGTTNITIQAPTSVTSYLLTLPGAVGGAGTVLTDVAGNGVLSWAAGGSSSLTSTYVGYGSGGNALTGEAAFTYTAASNTIGVDTIQLGATGVNITNDSDGAITFLGSSAGSDEDLTLNLDDVANTVGVTSSTGVTTLALGGIGITSTGANSIGPLVDSVDGTTPLNNVNQVVAAGTAYTMTASYASLDFGTTDPVLTIANAGTYSIYVNIQFNLVGATYATYDSVTAKLRRTNNTAADLTGSTFGTFIPTITTITAVGPYLSIGPIKYTTALTSDTITVQALLNSTPSVGSVTASACTITAIRAY